MRNSIWSWLAVVGGLAAAHGARADTYEDQGMYSYAWAEPRLQSGIGVGVSVGGGITGFTDKTVRNAVSSDVGGLWDLRVSLGTHIPIGLDISYIGTAQNVQTFTRTSNGTLIGTTVEGAVRFNMLPHYTFDPYVFAGMGWQRYDTTDTRFATSDSGMRDHDNVAEFPLGAGVSLRDPSGFTADVRGTFRPTTDSRLIVDQRGNAASLHTWEASAAIGYEF